MKTSGYIAFLFLLSCLLVIGCGDPQRAKLVGSWEIAQTDSLMRRLDETDAGGGANDAEVIATSPKMQLQFFRNGGLKTTTAMGTVTPTPKQGRWEMVSYDEASRQMQVKCQIGMQETEHEIEFVDADSIKLVPPNMAGLNMRLRFQRKK